MSAKTSAEVVIDGKVYTLSGYEGEEYLQKVAAYINNKLGEFDSIEEYRHISPAMKSTLIQLNIADDYFKAKEQVIKLERDIENKDKELYDLKHDLISNQIKTENAEASMKELEAENKEIEVQKTALEAEKKKLETEKKKLEAENKELVLNKSRLEAALEDKLLDQKPAGKPAQKRH